MADQNGAALSIIYPSVCGGEVVHIHIWVCVHVCGEQRLTLGIGNLFNYSLIFVIDVSPGPKAHQSGQVDWHKEPPVSASLAPGLQGTPICLAFYVGAREQIHSYNLYWQ